MCKWICRRGEEMLGVLLAGLSASSVSSIPVYVEHERLYSKNNGNAVPVALPGSTHARSCKAAEPAWARHSVQGLTDEVTVITVARPLCILQLTAFSCPSCNNGFLHPHCSCPWSTQWEGAQCLLLA